MVFTSLKSLISFSFLFFFSIKGSLLETWWGSLEKGVKAAKGRGHRKRGGERRRGIGRPGREREGEGLNSLENG